MASLSRETLAIAEVRYVTETARRIAALLALQTQLDENYRAVRPSAITLARRI